MLPTPETPAVPDSIYPPSEDSYLLLDTLSDPEQISFLTTRFANPPCPLITDLGTGSGVILALVMAHAQRIFGRVDVLGLGIDLNADACIYSRNTVMKNCGNQVDSHGVYLTTINSSLFQSLRPGEVDVLIFNPPYVPTSEVPTSEIAHPERPTSRDEVFDRNSHLLSLSYSGGKDGMEVTNKVLHQLNDVLSPRGVAYILLCKANKVEEVIQRIETWSESRGSQWEAKVVRSSGKQAGWERLVVLRIWRSGNKG